MTKFATQFAAACLRATIYAWRYGAAPFLAMLGAGRCRFAPSCSAYALEAVNSHGPARGAALALKRICRCHPWGGAGHDPVPTCPKQEISHGR
ncbi:MAG: membrane protein insertion efficiency factor YidD [Alphaproteobacteria bacterium]|nr:membrane protein insertion efficiency factor YidD [Alphaproteobacteria bacterium]